MPSFSVRLRSSMLSAGIKDAKELADRVGVSKTIVSKWMKSPRPNLSAEHLLKVAKTLHVRAHWLGSGEGPSHRFHASEYTESDLLRTFRGLGERERVLLRDVMGIVLKYMED